MTLSLDGNAELVMQHAYKKYLLQKFEVTRELALERRLKMEEKGGIDSVWTKPSADLSQRRRKANLDPGFKHLVLALDQFITTSGSGRSDVAGFHWFTDCIVDLSTSAVSFLSNGCVSGV